MAGIGGAALPLPKSSQARRGPQLPGLALLAPRRLDGLAKALFGCRGLVERLGQQQLSHETVQLGLLAALVILLRKGQTLVQRPARFFESACPRVRIAQDAQLEWKGQLGAA